MGSAPTVLQGRPSVEITTLEGQDEGTLSATTARKLTFSTVARAEKPTAAEVVQGNRSQQLGLNLTIFLR